MYHIYVCTCKSSIITFHFVCVIYSDIRKYHLCLVDAPRRTFTHPKRDLLALLFFWKGNTTLIIWCLFKNFNAVFINPF